jgi:hypothetical protein
VVFVTITTCVVPGSCVVALYLVHSSSPVSRSKETRKRSIFTRYTPPLDIKHGVVGLDGSRTILLAILFGLCSSRPRSCCVLTEIVRLSSISLLFVVYVFKMLGNLSYS